MHSSTTLKQLLNAPAEERRLGQFQLLRPLGRGGQAPVWLAKEVYGDTELRLAALKLFSVSADERGGSTGPISRPGYRARVLEEAKALCRVEHPNITRFYSIASNDSGSVVGVAMEYLTGFSLEARLIEKGSLALEETLVAGAGIASALSAVHRAGLVHRDVKPANIVDAGGSYKLIDFGIAWEDPGDAPMQVLVDDLPLAVSPEEKSQITGAMTMRNVLELTGSQTSTASLLHSGTIGYVDPACLRLSEKATPASDLYALGVVLFECVTGKHPAAIGAADGEGLKQTVLDGRERAVPLASIASDLPKSFCDLVDRMLAPEPDQRPRSADWVAVELERIRGELAGKKREMPPEAVGPFRGMGRFEASDRAIYFGRSSEIAAALELLRTNGLVSLVGTSGSGKSSLARAGVLPRVEDGGLGRGIEAWDTLVISPGPDPHRAVLTALRRLPTGGATEMMFEPTLEPSDVVGMLALRAQATGRGTLLLVDQLEELVTLDDVGFKSSRSWVADFLAAVGSSALPGVRALVTARRDLLDPLLTFPALGKVLVRGTLLVEPLSDASWAEVITQALDAYGYTLEEGLYDSLLASLRGTAGAMPLVGFALSELWDKRDASAKVVRREALDAIGGIAGSLDRHADATIGALVRENPSAEGLVREMLLTLTTPQGTRAIVEADKLAPGTDARRAILNGLERARLVTIGPDGVTLAHEALLTQWRKLQSWLSEVREQRILAEELERDAAKHDREPETVPLWQRRRLAMALDLLSDGQVSITKRATRFVEASERAQRRSRLALGAVAAVIVLFASASGFTYVGALRADERAAHERATLEESKAKLEQARREELEEAQSALDEKQKRIDGLVAELEKADDPKALMKTLKDEAEQARAVQKKIAVSSATGSKPRDTAKTADAGKTPETAGSAKPVRPSIQRGDE
jgi:eukaryotic-like serine/threonine-protein kinase